LDYCAPWHNLPVGADASTGGKGLVKMPSPLNEVREISKLAYGFMASKALFAALNLELFGHVALGADSAEKLSALTGVALARMKTLIAALVSTGVLIDDNGVISNAPATQSYLVPGAPAYFGDYYRFQIGGQIYAILENLDAGLIGDEERLAHSRMSGWLSDPKQAEDFSRAQHAGSLGPAHLLSKKLDLSGAGSLLDVAGGTGAYSITFCQDNPELRATILDFPTVIDVARRYVNDAKMADRITLAAGDARETEWPGGQDVVLMSYLLSAVDGDQIPPLVGRAYEALNPGGLLVLHDFMLTEDRSGPSSAALFFLQYLAYQPGAVSFTAGELQPIVSAAGFQDFESQVMIPEITMMITARKPLEIG
jgi:ubiquinone/menaquinone biosynthesis C-methylase UbiE